MHVHVTDIQDADAGTTVRPLCWKWDLPYFAFCLEFLLCFASWTCDIAFPSPSRPTGITDCRSGPKVSRACGLRYDWSDCSPGTAACSNTITGINTVELGDYQCRLQYMNEWGFCTHKIEQSTFHEISIKLKGDCCDHAVTSALPTSGYVSNKIGPPVFSCSIRKVPTKQDSEFDGFSQLFARPSRRRLANVYLTFDGPNSSRSASPRNEI